MKSKDAVIEGLLNLNPSIKEVDLNVYDDYVAWSCQHNLEHIVYTEDGSPFYSPDDCGRELATLDPLPETDVVRCEDCGTLTPKEIMTKGRCPICAEYL
jgi:DNA-directed RNA polymerase subunit RPC12/RpoP